MRQLATLKNTWNLLIVLSLSFLLASCAGGAAKNIANNLLAEQNFAVVHDYNSNRYYALSSPEIYDYVEMRVTEEEQEKMQNIAAGKYTNEQLEEIIKGQDFYLVRNAAVLQLAANYYNVGQADKGKDILAYFNYPLSIRTQKALFTSLNNPVSIFN
ncbi:hypothetical protein CKF54_07855 [Psittacicella hinzii]|uniref:Uncharacterized protein n=1 Tax=Psittacicella hinzii TaxID=2028575 RepID=A0A3A1XYM4_9GAMM|nr:hypothetical protein [Psittacicella hinzii]RIY31073.1 hypothetical protein CKF54_07855 [Psittacicella hinzii]